MSTIILPRDAMLADAQETIFRTRLAQNEARRVHWRQPTSALRLRRNQIPPADMPPMNSRTDVDGSGTVAV